MSLSNLDVLAAGARFLSTAAITMFFGASMYVIKVEHPARMAMSSGEGIVRHFQEHFPRAMMYQKKFPMMSMLCGLVGWYLDDDPARWLSLSAVVCTVLGCWIWTFKVIMPVNYQLMGPDLLHGSEGPRKKGDAWAVDMATRWYRRHTVRAILSGVAALLWATYWGNKIYKFL